MRFRRSTTRLAILAVLLGAAGAMTLPRLSSDVAADVHPELADEPHGRIPGARYTSMADHAPVTRRDEARASAAALAAPAVVRRGGARVVLVRPYGPFEPGDVAANDPCMDRACLDVTVVFEQRDTALDVLVDPARAEVLRIRPSAGPPPLSPDEREQAHTLAEADAKVIELIAGEAHRHPGVLTKPMWPAGICDEHRCGTVVFTFGDYAETGVGRVLNVVVDMTTRTIVERTTITCSPECTRGWGR